MSLRIQNYNSNDSEPIISDMQEKGHETSEIHIITAQ